MSEAAKILNCEEEPIHLCGKIQDFGYLLVFNLIGKCIAISENCRRWLPLDLPAAMQLKIHDFLGFIYQETGVKIESLDLSHISRSPLTFKTHLHGECFQLTIYIHNDLIFLEFEKNESIVIELSQLNEFQRNFDFSDNIWQTLCENIYRIIGFDRIMVYQFLEDSSGIVIAEKKTIQEESLLGYRYPEFDIPQQARKLYLKNLARQTPDIHADTVPLFGAEPTQIDLSKSQIRALSPIHLQYLHNFGVRASASFSIVIDDKLWGLVACQNITPKFIPYDRKSLCLFVTHYAATKYLVEQQRIKIEDDQKIKEIELELKERLVFNSSIEKTLKEFAKPFMQAIPSSGLIIRSPDFVTRYGETPNDYLLEEIHAEINSRIGDENIFTSHAFSLPNNKKTDNSNWTGVARISFDKEHDYAIYWFRKEILTEEKWAGIPEKHPIFSEEKNAYIYSPRTSFQLWKKQVKGQSERWSTFDINFLTRIHKLIQDSLLRKINEVKRLNERLIEANNKLETYTHQLAHDIRNPLSIIKTSAQFIYAKQDLTRDFLGKFSKNIAEAADLINSIIDKTIESTKESANILSYEVVTTETFIHQIIQQAVQRYGVKNYEVILGDLLPVYGEKTLLYQLFMNLINNAIKFSSKKNTAILEIYSKTEDNNTIYYIKDNGIGIAETEKENLFGMFKRLSNANEFEGSGVGMAIVKRIIDKLHANIEFQSKVNEGTTFKIAFPNE